VLVVGLLAGRALGIGALFLLIGLIAETMTGFLLDNPQFADQARQAGFEVLLRAGIGLMVRRTGARFTGPGGVHRRGAVGPWPGRLQLGGQT
jgi:hypothetical protein